MAILRNLHPPSHKAPTKACAARFTATIDVRVPRTAQIVARDELDIATAPLLADAFTSVTGEEPAVVLDLRAVSFCDAAGLRTILGGDAQLQQAGQSLLVIRGPRATHRLFALTGVDHALRMIDAAPEDLLA
jgi:anti-anti-sigma factor